MSLSGDSPQGIFLGEKRHFKDETKLEDRVVSLLGMDTRKERAGSKIGGVWSQILNTIRHGTATKINERWENESEL